MKFVLLLLATGTFIASTLIAASSAVTLPGEQGEGCAMLSPAKAKTVFGTFDSAMQYSTDLPGKDFGAHGRIPEQSWSRCIFRRNATGEELQIQGFWYSDYEDAAKAFETASKAPAFYTKAAKIGPIQIFEGKGRSVGYLGNRWVKAQWIIGEDVKGIPGEKLAPLVVAVMCPNYPDCKVSATKP